LDLKDARGLKGRIRRAGGRAGVGLRLANESALRGFLAKHVPDLLLGRGGESGHLRRLFWAEPAVPLRRILVDLGAWGVQDVLRWFTPFAWPQGARA